MSGLSEQQERFCRFIVEGFNQREAYQKAGYIGPPESLDANASRLIRQDKVQNRIAELRAPAAEKASLTAAHFAKRLERLAAAAERSAFKGLAGFAAQPEFSDQELLALAPKDAADVARHCTMDAAKILGLIVEKAEVTDKTVYSVANRPQTDEAWETEFSPAQRPN